MLAVPDEKYGGKGGEREFRMLVRGVEGGLRI